MLDCSVALAIPKSASLTSPSAGAQQVAGLDVAVHDAVAVGVVESLAGLFDDREPLLDLDPAVVTQDLRAGVALDVLHHDEVLVGALVAAGVEHLHDVRVDQPRGGLCLALEARDEGGVVGEMLGQQLDGDLALEAQVHREMDGRHAAEAEPALEPVAPGDLGAPQFPAPPLPLPPLLSSERPAARAGPGAVAFTGAGVPPPVPASSSFFAFGRRRGGVVVVFVCVEVVGVVVVCVVVVVVSASSRCWSGRAAARRLLSRPCAGFRSRCGSARAVASRREQGSATKSWSVFSERCFGRPSSCRCRLRRPSRPLRCRSAAAPPVQPGSGRRPSCRTRRAARRRRRAAPQARAREQPRGPRHCPYSRRSASESGRRAARIAAAAPAMS